MKFEIHKVEKREDKKFKKYFEVLLLVFTLTLITVILALSRINEKIDAENDISKDYVSVFKESELYEILFSSINEQ